MTTELQDPDILLVRYGELALKGGNRALFENALVRNLQGALKHVGGGEVIRRWGRIQVKPAGRWREAMRACAQTFGIKSVSPAWNTERNLESMVAMGRRLLENKLQEYPPGSQPSFRVTVKRADKTFPMTSGELALAIADGMLDEDSTVLIQMKNADIDFNIDLRPEGTFAFLEREPGPGGLPVKTLGRGLCLLSGGIDSPVAAWCAMKRGLKVSFVSFHSPPYIGEGSRMKIRDLIRVLAEWQGPSTLHEVQFADIQLAIREGAPESLRTILYRRSMQRIASHLARRSKTGALITGENLGQVASQTLENLACIGAAANIQVLRPLITHDKEDVIAFAKRIGTFDVSIRDEPDCCTVFQPRKPALRAQAPECETIEAELGLVTLEEAQVRASAKEHIHPGS